MASRYWVGGTGTWDGVTTTNWSTSSGGSSGASAPTSSDTATFDSNSGISAGVTITITGAAAALVVSYTGPAVKTSIWTLSGSPTFGTVTFGGGSTQGVSRLLVQSSVVGTQRTITAAAYVINGDIDFMDANLAYSGAASWTNTGSAYIGDCGGNSGAVTTNATGSATQTATGTASFTWSTHGWTSRVPLPQDNVNIPNAFVAGRTITQDMPRAGRSITLTCTGNPVWNAPVNFSLYGGMTLATGMTFQTGTGRASFLGRQGITITTNAVAALFPLTFNCPTGTVTLADNLTNSSPSTNPWIWTAGTLSAGTSTISFTDTTAAKTFAGGGQTYGTVQFAATGAFGFTITGNNTFANLNLECSTARTITLPASGTQTVTGTLTLTGAAGQLLSLVSSTPGTATTIVVADGSTVTLANYSFSSDIVCHYKFPAVLGIGMV